jgi:hypothetical protein
MAYLKSIWIAGVTILLTAIALLAWQQSDSHSYTEAVLYSNELIIVSAFAAFWTASPAIRHFLTNRA